MSYARSAHSTSGDGLDLHIGGLALIVAEIFLDSLHLGQVEGGAPVMRNRQQPASSWSHTAGFRHFQMPPPRWGKAGSISPMA